MLPIFQIELPRFCATAIRGRSKYNYAKLAITLLQSAGGLQRDILPNFLVTPTTSLHRCYPVVAFT